jgi:O-antigen/teichoic acid export membrane protein
LLRAAIAKLSRHTLTYAAADQVSRLASFLLLPLVTGYLEPSEYGARELLATTLAVLAQAAGLNVTTAISRFYFEQPTEARRRALVSTTFLSVGGLACFFALLLWLLAPAVARLLPTEIADLPHLLRISLGIFVFQMLREALNKALQTQERSALYGALSVSKLVVEIGLQVYFLVVLRAGLEGLLWAVLIAEGLFALLTAAILLPRVGLGFSTSMVVLLFGFALPLVPQGMLQFCLHSADKYMVGALGSDTALGVYTLGYKLGQVPNFLVLGPFLLIWYPFVFSVADDDRRRELLRRLAPYVLWPLSLVAFAVAIFAPELVRAAAGRSDFHPAWVAVPFVAFGYWFWGLFQILQTGFYVRKTTRPLPVLAAAGVAVNLFLNVVLIPALGFVGAAVATSITFAALSWTTALQVRDVYPVAHAWGRILGPALAAAALTAAVLAAGDRLPAPVWPIKLALVTAWCAWCWLGGAIDAGDRAAALAALRRAKP